MTLTDGTRLGSYGTLSGSSRDLEPEKWMVSKDGFVEILDLGPARRIEPVT
jgi:hypothetical protein